MGNPDHYCMGVSSFPSMHGADVCACVYVHVCMYACMYLLPTGSEQHEVLLFGSI